MPILTKMNEYEDSDNSLSDYEDEDEYVCNYDEKILTKEDLDKRTDLLLPKKGKNIPSFPIIVKPSIAKQIFFQLSRSNFEPKKTENVIVKNDVENKIENKTENKTFSWGKVDKSNMDTPKNVETNDFPSLSNVEKTEEKSLPKMTFSKGKLEKAELPEKMLGIKFSFSNEKPKKMCRYFLNGENCPKGDECVFLHEVNEEINECYYGKKCNNPNCIYLHTEGKDEFKKQVEKDIKKTKICREWEKDGKCDRGTECKFAHGSNELKKPECFFGIKCNNPTCKFTHNVNLSEKLLEKTKICRQWAKFGSCPRGNECTFAHGKNQLVISKCVYGEKCRNKETCKYRHEDVPLFQEKQSTTIFPKNNPRIVSKVENEKTTETNSYYNKFDKLNELN